MITSNYILLPADAMLHTTKPVFFIDEVTCEPTVQNVRCVANKQVNKIRNSLTRSPATDICTYWVFW